MASLLINQATELVKSSGIKYETNEALADAVDFMYKRLVKLEEEEAERTFVDPSCCMPEAE